MDSRLKPVIFGFPDLPKRDAGHPDWSVPKLDTSALSICCCIEGYKVSQVNSVCKTIVVVCTDLSGKNPRRQEGMNRVLISAHCHKSMPILL